MQVRWQQKRRCSRFRRRQPDTVFFHRKLRRPRCRDSDVRQHDGHGLHLHRECRHGGRRDSGREDPEPSQLRIQRQRRPGGGRSEYGRRRAQGHRLPVHGQFRAKGGRPSQRCGVVPPVQLHLRGQPWFGERHPSSQARSGVPCGGDSVHHPGWSRGRAGRISGSGPDCRDLLQRSRRTRGRGQFRRRSVLRCAGSLGRSERSFHRPRARGPPCRLGSGRLSPEVAGRSLGPGGRGLGAG